MKLGRLNHIGIATIAALSSCSPAMVDPDSDSSNQSPSALKNSPQNASQEEDVISGAEKSKYERYRTVSTSFGPVFVGEFKYDDGEAGHATSGRLDAIYLSGMKRFPSAVEIGSMGHVGEWAVVNTFTNFPVIYASGGFTGQGITEGCATLTELRPEGPALIAVIPDYYSNSGLVEDEAAISSTEGKIGSIKRNREFTVTYSGSQTGRVRYVWEGGKFVPKDRLILEGC